MSGLYLHIPFCHRACSYCDFHFSTSLKNKENMLIALRKEMELRKDFLPNERIATLYIGGGTPSVLSGKEIRELIRYSQCLFDFDPHAEITIEVNPEDVSIELANHWIESGINRVSLGIQSLDFHSLHFLNRKHSRASSMYALDILRSAGFGNISIDIITGIPELSDETLEENLHSLMEKKPEHFSVYSLTIEEKTLLGFKQKKGELRLKDEHSAQQYELAKKILNHGNYIAYEVSNFALNQQLISKHNSSYWKMKPYLGIGPSAHSFDGKNRFKNYSNNARYIHAINQQKWAGEYESLSDKDIFNDTLITGLRTMWGVNSEQIANYLTIEERIKFNQIKQKLVAAGDVIQERETIKIPEEKYIISDSILIKLML